jgi:hypothetical protein
LNAVDLLVAGEDLHRFGNEVEAMTSVTP